MNDIDEATRQRVDAIFEEATSVQRLGIELTDMRRGWVHTRLVP